MEAVFHLTSEEFDQDVFDKLKSLLNGKKNVEITIAISEDQFAKGFLRKETREDYFERLDKAIDDLNKGKGTTFTKEEFETFSKQLLNEP